MQANTKYTLLRYIGNHQDDYEVIKESTNLELVLDYFRMYNNPDNDLILFDSNGIGILSKRKGIKI